jgi:hypothetical protein
MLEEATGTKLLDPRLALVDALQVERGDLALALEVMAQEVTPTIRNEIARLSASLVGEPADLELWRVQTEAARAQIRWSVASGISLLLATRDGEIASLPERGVIEASVSDWIAELAFREIDPSESALTRYAVIARFQEARIGPAQVLAQIETAPLPAEGSIEHALRGSGQAQLERDLSFARISPTFWASELASLFAQERSTLDVERVAFLARRYEQAREEARVLGLDHRSFERESREVRLIAALATGDEHELRRRLREIKVENDRRMRMNAASWIATASRFQTAPRFERVVAIWREEVDYKPMWFWIAWSAALSGATDQALFVAKSAAREYPDDRAFAEEYQFMKRRFAAPQSAGRQRPAVSTRSSTPESRRRPGTATR